MLEFIIAALILIAFDVAAILFIRNDDRKLEEEYAAYRQHINYLTRSYYDYD